MGITKQCLKKMIKSATAIETILRGMTYFLIGAFIGTMILFLTGCGHNAVQYSDGVGVEIGFIPEQYQVAVNFRYGKIFSAVVKEKAEVSLTTDASNEAKTGDDDSTVSGKDTTGVKTVLTLKTGDQTTGYCVDLEKAKAENKQSSDVPVIETVKTVETTAKN